MNRRDFLQCAAVLAAGASVFPQSWSMSHEQHAFLASQPNYIDRHPLTFFDEVQRAAVSAIADQVIPATETPGAVEAGAPRFIELMVADWFNDGERTFFMAGLADLQSRAGGSFAVLTQEAQLALLETLEDEASDSPWFQIGNVQRVWDDSAPFICQFKELTVLGFMLSEVGGTRFLRENTMGAFDGDVPLATDDAAYAAEMPMRLVTRS
ncbi:MAG: gluconate 2-dehydrogenase subunit 3 family protein [Halioglobus sp.]